jgi:hypothetical protein
MTADDLKRALAAMDAEQVFDEILLAPSAHFFRNRFGEAGDEQYERFQTLVGKVFNISPSGVALIGSAKLGFSLNPAHLFREFRRGSDFDVAVVCEEAFEALWSTYRNTAYRNPGRNLTDQRNAIFKMFVTTESLQNKDDDFELWERTRLGPLRRRIGDTFDFYGDVKFRIYRSHEPFRYYHIRGIESVQSRLVNSG